MRRSETYSHCCSSRSTSREREREEWRIDWLKRICFPTRKYQNATNYYVLKKRTNKQTHSKRGGELICNKQTHRFTGATGGRDFFTSFSFCLFSEQVMPFAGTFPLPFDFIYLNFSSFLFFSFLFSSQYWINMKKMENNSKNINFWLVLWTGPYKLGLSSHVK